MLVAIVRKMKQEELNTCSLCPNKPILKTSGIYRIRNIVNNKIYIGSAINFNTRWGQHRRLLRRGKHFNSYLQNSWNKYKEDNFIFEIIEECAIEALEGREQFFLDSTLPSYNLSPVAIRGICSEQQKLEFIKKIKEKNQKHPRTPETILKMIESRKITRARRIKEIEEEIGKTWDEILEENRKETSKKHQGKGYVKEKNRIRMRERYHKIKLDPNLKLLYDERTKKSRNKPEVRDKTRQREKKRYQSEKFKEMNRRRSKENYQNEELSG